MAGNLGLLDDCCLSSRLSLKCLGASSVRPAAGGASNVAVVPGAVTAAGACSGSCRGELVAVKLAEVVGHHQQAPLGAHFDPASPVEAVDAVVVLGVAEQRLDGLSASSVEPPAVL
jgi:hypothetical protein